MWVFPKIRDCFLGGGVYTGVRLFMEITMWVYGNYSGPKEVRIYVLSDPSIYYVCT